MNYVRENDDRTVKIDLILDIDVPNGQWQASEGIRFDAPQTIDGPMWYQLVVLAEGGLLVHDSVALHLSVEVDCSHDYATDTGNTYTAEVDHIRVVRASVVVEAEEKFVPIDHDLIKSITGDPEFLAACGATAEEEAYTS